MSFQSYDHPVYLTSLKRHFPERVVTNDDLVQWMGKTIRGSWIEKRTGIKQRYWVGPEGSTRQLAREVGKEVLDAKDETLKLGYLILATISGDFLTPPSAPLLQNDLGLEGVGAFDLGAACSGFVTALHVAAALAGQDKAVLLLSAEVRSKFLNSEDFATATLFGDGAAGCVVSVAPGAKGFRVIASQIFSDGSVGDVISVPSGGSLSPAATETDKTKFYLKMKDGAEIFFKAVEGMREAGVHFLQNCGMGVGDIQWLVPHQANGFLIEALGDKLEIPKEKVVNVIQNMGNTSGATVGIALSFLLENPNLKSGDKVLLLAAGGGGLAACALLEYSA